MRKLLLCFLLALPLMAAEKPNCYVTTLAINGSTVPNQVRLQLKDQLSSTALYNARIYLDDPTATSLTNVVATTSTTSTFVYTIANANFGTGTINPMDGAQHHFYFAMDTLTQGTLKNCTGNGWPYKYDTGSSQSDYTYPLYSTLQQRGATASTIAVLANKNDTYSVGSVAGNAICPPISGTQLYDNGVAGKYIQAHGISCANAHTVNIPATNSITQAQAATALATLTPALSSTEQFLAIAWSAPVYFTQTSSWVGQAGTYSASRESIPYYFATSGGIVTEQTITVAGAIFPGDPQTTNPYFLSTSATPFTSYGIRPAMMLLWGTCNASCNGITPPFTWTPSFSSASTGINAAVAAVDTNPTGGKIYTQSSSGDFARSNGYVQMSPKAFGLNTGVAPTALGVTTAAIVSTSATVTSSSILSYEVAATGAAPASTPSFIAAGTGYMHARTSLSGEMNGANQEPPLLYLSYGAAFSCGSDSEPAAALSTKYPETELLMSTYTRGSTAVESAWRSTKYMSNTVCVGDPLASPFSAASALVAVPNVVNTTQAAATTAITTATLVLGTVTTASSLTIVAGNVISQSPAAASNVAAGSAVDIVVSTGIPPIPAHSALGKNSAYGGNSTLQ